MPHLTALQHALPYIALHQQVVPHTAVYLQHTCVAVAAVCCCCASLQNSSGPEYTAQALLCLATACAAHAADLALHTARFIKHLLQCPSTPNTAQKLAAHLSAWLCEHDCMSILLPEHVAALVQNVVVAQKGLALIAAAGNKVAKFQEVSCS